MTNRMTKTQSNINLVGWIACLCLLISCKKEAPLPPLDPLELTIAQVHEAFEAGTLTAESLMQTYLHRIDSLDTLLNAITYINPSALEEAKSMDVAFQSSGKLLPLHGIPMIVKDNFNTKGMPTTAGALALKDFIPQTNATMVQQLLDAGAIIIAKSNMAEWAFSPRHTESSTLGTTFNPYNLDHVPAGSSGGTAAAIAANLGLIGLGTDTGNSIRGPSSHCALVGFRSTLGLTSREGVVPLYLRNDVAGPMCRTVADATRVLEVIAAVDPLDPLTQHATGNIPDNYQQFLQRSDLKGVRIGVLRRLSEQDPHPEVKENFEKAILDLRQLGAEVLDSVDIPNFDQLKSNQWCPVFKSDIEAFLSKYVKVDSISTLADIIRIGSTSEYAKQGLASFAQAGNNLDGRPCTDAYTDPRRVAFRKAIEMVMDSLEIDALIYPSWNHPPSTIDNFLNGYKGDNSQIIAPHTGQPAFSIPMGFTSTGLPTGLQLLGRMYGEPQLIRIAYAYEQKTKHRVSPKSFE